MKFKGDYIKELKAAGVRKGEKNGQFASLEALKTHEIINLYYKTFKNG